MNKEYNEIAVLIGNGLGRSFANEKFHLEEVLNEIHKEEEDNEEFNVLRQIFPVSGPNEEEEIGKLSELSSLEILGNTLIYSTLNPDFAIKAKEAYKKLKHLILKKLARNANEVFNKQEFKKRFKAPFLEFIKEQQNDHKLTITTLNYDPLIYKIFEEDNLFSEKGKHHFVDGFKIEEKKGCVFTLFEDIFFDELFKKNRSLLLHLHGSCNFQIVEDHEKIKRVQKMEFSERFQRNNENLVILTSRGRKLGEIASAPGWILTVYFRAFLKVLFNSRGLIIYGYSGNDEHINENLRSIIKRRCMRRDPINIEIISRKDFSNGVEKDYLKKWCRILDVESHEIEFRDNKKHKKTKNGNNILIKNYKSIHEYDWKPFFLHQS